jgi:FkbM family methyltransferase
VSDLGRLVSEAPVDPPEIDRILTRFSGDLAIDVGANIGRTVDVLAKQFSRVLALEPAEESFEVLSSRCAHLENVLCLPHAVSDRCDDIELVVCANKITTGQLVTESWTEWGAQIERRRVPAVTIDAMADTFGDPDFIKVDVEGHEVLVIKGGMRAIPRVRPALYIEIHRASLGVELYDMLGPFYPDMHAVRHPHYELNSWGYFNHYWLVASHG